MSTSTFTTSPRTRKSRPIPKQPATEAALTEAIASVRAIFNRFPCKGTCRERDEKKCCYSCKGMIGYLYAYTSPWTYAKSQESLHPSYKALWDEKNGFWTPTGCALPDSMKSTVCLCFGCDDWFRVHFGDYNNQKRIDMNVKLAELGDRIRSLRTSLGKSCWK
jgi:hypothetical protein